MESERFDFISQCVAEYREEKGIVANRLTWMAMSQAELARIKENGPRIEAPASPLEDEAQYADFVHYGNLTDPRQLLLQFQNIVLKLGYNPTESWDLLHDQTRYLILVCTAAMMGGYFDPKSSWRNKRGEEVDREWIDAVAQNPTKMPKKSNEPWVFKNSSVLLLYLQTRVLDQDHRDIQAGYKSWQDTPVNHSWDFELSSQFALLFILSQCCLDNANQPDSPFGTDGTFDARMRKTRADASRFNRLVCVQQQPFREVALMVLQGDDRTCYDFIFTGVGQSHVCVYTDDPPPLDGPTEGGFDLYWIFRHHTWLTCSSFTSRIMLERNPYEFTAHVMDGNFDGYASAQDQFLTWWRWIGRVLQQNESMHPFTEPNLTSIRNHAIGLEQRIPADTLPCMDVESLVSYYVVYEDGKQHVEDWLLAMVYVHLFAEKCIGSPWCQWPMEYIFDVWYGRIALKKPEEFTVGPQTFYYVPRYDYAFPYALSQSTNPSRSLSYTNLYTLLTLADLGNPDMEPWVLDINRAAQFIQSRLDIKTQWALAQGMENNVELGLMVEIDIRAKRFNFCAQVAQAKVLKWTKERDAKTANQNSDMVRHNAKLSTALAALRGALKDPRMLDQIQHLSQRGSQLSNYKDQLSPLLNEPHEYAVVVKLVERWLKKARDINAKWAKLQSEVTHPNVFIELDRWKLNLMAHKAELAPHLNPEVHFKSFVHEYEVWVRETAQLETEKGELKKKMRDPRDFEKILQYGQDGLRLLDYKATVSPLLNNPADYGQFIIQFERMVKESIQAETDYAQLQSYLEDMNRRIAIAEDEAVRLTSTAMQVQQSIAALQAKLPPLPLPRLVFVKEHWAYIRRLKALFSSPVQGLKYVWARDEKGVVSVVAEATGRMRIF